MSSSRLLFPLCLLSFSLLLQLAFATNPTGSTEITNPTGSTDPTPESKITNPSHPTAWSCSGSANFTPNGTYNTNMNNLLSYLDSNTPLSGYSNPSMGLNPDQVYGLALCRGDINPTDCQACINEASNEIQHICPFKEEAFIWYDYCQVKYSNVDFFGQIDNSEWRLASSQIIVSDPASFSRRLMELLSLLVEDAYVSPKLYAAGAMGTGSSENIYGLVQCTRDLSSVDCKSCIDACSY